MYDLYTAGQATAVVQLQGMDPPVGLDKAQQAAWLKDKQFLQQLMDNTKVLPAYCTLNRIVSAVSCMLRVLCTTCTQLTS